MPAVSFYLKQDILETVRTRAKSHKISVSKIIQEAVEHYLAVKDTELAKERVLDFFTRERPLGGMKALDEFHRERAEADACKG